MFWDSLACLALGPHRPSVSPVLCGLRLTRLTGLTCCKGICRVCGVWFLCGFCCLWFSGSVLLSVFVLFLVPFASLHALALSLTGA